MIALRTKGWIVTASMTLLTVLGVVQCNRDDLITNPTRRGTHLRFSTLPPGTIHVGQWAVIKLISHTCTGVDVLTVSGAISATLSSDACHLSIGTIWTLGPAAEGTLSFTLNDPRFYCSSTTVYQGDYPSYTALVDDTECDFEQTPDDAVLSVEILSNCQNNVMRLSQDSSAWGDSVYDDITGKMKDFGCSITSLAMGLNSAGISKTPLELNQYMRTNGLFDSTGGARLDKATRMLARDAGHPTWRLKDAPVGTDPVKLARLLCDSARPILVGVQGSSGKFPGHYVIATGVQNARVMIADPGYNRTFLDDPAYTGKGFTKPRYVGDPPGDMSGLDIDVNDADLLVTDPLSRSTGLDFPAGGQEVSQIPRSDYSLDAIDDDVTGAAATHSTSTVNIFEPLDGTYRIDVRATLAGGHQIVVNPFSSDGSPQPATTIPVNLVLGQVMSFFVSFSGGSGPLLYFLMDENTADSIHGVGRANLTLSRPTCCGGAQVITGHSGQARAMNYSNTTYTTADGTPFVTVPYGTSWSVAVWFNKDIGYWGSGSGGGHFHGGSSYNMAAAFLIAPPGSSDVGQTNAVVYPLNWWATGAPSDTSLSSIELQLFYYYGNNSSGQHTNLRTGFFANQLGSSPNGWHHLAVVNDLGGNTLAFYVDGNRVYSGPALDVSTFGSGADQGIIKWTFTGNSTLLNNAWGSMDELYIYQRALSAAEVQQLYTSP